MKVAASLFVVLSLFVVSCQKDRPAPSDSPIGWAVGRTTSEAGVVYKTLDGGKTWMAQTGPTDFQGIVFNGVCALNEKECCVIGSMGTDESGLVYVTRDGGITWKRTGENIAFTGCLGITSADKKTLWVVGKGTIYRSGDAGRTWTAHQIDMGEQIFRGENISTYDGTNIYACGGLFDENVQQKAVIVFSNDAGRTWKYKSFEENTTFIDISTPGKQMAYAVGGNGYAIKMTDNFDHIETLKVIAANSIDLNGVYAVDENKAWVTVDYGVIRYTTDGGKTWQSPEHNGTNGGNAVMRVAILKNGAGVAISTPLTGNTTGEIIYSTDGTSWDPVLTVEGTVAGLSFVQSRRK